MADQWYTVDAYLNALFAPEDVALEETLQSTVEAQMPLINVAPNQGKLLQVLAHTVGARRILEIGTLAGYSTIWMARALPADGRLITLELQPDYAAIARTNIVRAGLGHLIDIRVGPAIETLPVLAAEQHVFDLVFIDADKESTPAYLAWALKMVRAGSLIVIDNVVRDGAVADPRSADERVQGIRRGLELLAQTPGVTATALQTVGIKGYDGLAIGVVNALD